MARVPIRRPTVSGAGAPPARMSRRATPGWSPNEITCSCNCVPNRTGWTQSCLGFERCLWKSRHHRRIGGCACGEGAKRSITNRPVGRGPAAGRDGSREVKKKSYGYSPLRHSPGRAGARCLYCLGCNLMCIIRRSRRPRQECRKDAGRRQARTGDEPGRAGTGGAARRQHGVPGPGTGSGAGRRRVQTPPGVAPMRPRRRPGNGSGGGGAGQPRGAFAGGPRRG